MKKTKIFIVALLASVSGLKAQQLPIYSQYMLNDFCMNPAIAGTKPNFELNSDDRFQWIGITDAPQTYILSLDGPITTEHIGIGFYVYTDITGPTRQTGFTSSYSYHMKLNDNLNLSLGISAGMLQFAIDGQDITTVQQGDPAIISEFQSVFVPAFAAGTYLYNDKFYVGLSAPQIIQTYAKITNIAQDDELVTHYYASAGYKFTLGNNFEFDPAFAANYATPTPPQFDLGARFLYKEAFWIGGGYRTLDAAYAMIGYVYEDNLTFGFSYDYPITNIHNYSFGTTELYIGIKFNRPKPAKEAKPQQAN
jgi:type IX secretion system PorP/SprF family membrane protein